MLIYLAELPGLGLAAFILDRLGRKISMEIMLVAGFVLLFPLVVHQNALMTTGFLFGARMFISASFIVVCIYTPEVCHTLCSLSSIKNAQNCNICIFLKFSNIFFIFRDVFGGDIIGVSYKHKNKRSRNSDSNRENRGDGKPFDSSWDG